MNVLKINLQDVRIVEALDLPDLRIKYVANRLDHDRRYAIDSKKIETELGWQPEYTFDTGIVKTIKWFEDNEARWPAVEGPRRFEVNKFEKRTNSDH